MKRLLTASILALICASSVAAQLAIAPDGALLPDGGVSFVVPVDIPLVPAPKPNYMWGPVTPLYPVIWPNVLVGAAPAARVTRDRKGGTDYPKPMSGRDDSWGQGSQSVRTDARGF